MNNQTRLLSKIIKDRDLSLALESNINESWFSDPTDKKIFRFLHDHYSNYQECPSLDVVKENFPSFELTAVEDSIFYLVDSLTNERRKQRIIATLGSALDAMEKAQDHESALRAMELGIIKLEEEGLNKSTDLEVTKAAQNAIDAYEHRKNNPGLLGIPTYRLLSTHT